MQVQILPFPVKYSHGHTYRCDGRKFTTVTVFPAIITVELMLMVRVLALCKSITISVSASYLYDSQMKIPK